MGHGEFVRDGAAGLDGGLEESVCLCAVSGRVDFIDTIGLADGDCEGGGARCKEDKRSEMHDYWLLVVGLWSVFGDCE